MGAPMVGSYAGSFSRPKSMHRFVSPPRVGALVRRFAPGLLLAFAVCASAAPADAQRALDPPVPTLLRGVLLEPEGDAVSVLLDGGRIASVLGVDAELPPGARELDGSGLLCLPAFHDAFTQEGLATPEPEAELDDPLDVRGDVRIDMRLANRKGIQPAFRGADASELSDKALERYRKSGFGVALQAPTGELLGGKSVLVALRDGALRDRIVRPEVHSHAAFDASGRGYPSTLMGYFSQLRQFFSDAERHSQLQQRFDAGRPGARPPFDPELDAGVELLKGRVLWCEAESRRDLRRWYRLGDEFRLELGFVGGRESGDLAELLAERGTPVVLTLDWGDEPDDPRETEDESEASDEESESDGPDGKGDTDDGEDSEGDDAADEGADDEGADDEGESEEEEEDLSAWVYTEPEGVRLERRERWERGRDAALALQAAGVRFAFGTADDKPGDLLGRVRDLVEAGLSREAALGALTRTPAAFAGLEARLGQVAAGFDATVVLWDGDPLTDKKAEVRYLFVDGYAWDAESAIDAGGEEDEDDRSNRAGEQARQEAKQ